MDLMLLKAFVQVTRSGSITAAASALGCSQPGLSQRIQTLERKLDCPLFHREPPGVRLTPAGDAVLPLARVLLAMTDAVSGQMLEELDRHRPEPPDDRPGDDASPAADREPGGDGGGGEARRVRGPE
jgi:DNA-binding transcriptional LysR family regulator